MPADLHLIKIWEHATFGAGFVGDAIKARRNDPKQDVTEELGNALVDLEKAIATIRKILATSHL